MKKNERLLFAIGNVDGKYISDASPSARTATSIRKAVALAASIVLIVALGLYMFLPFSLFEEEVDLTGSVYYPVIEKLKPFTATGIKYTNNFHKIISSIGGAFLNKGADDAPGDTGAALGSSAMPEGNGSYVENTDNQVAGVIEADVVKRTDKYIFSVYNNTLCVFEIAGKDSKKVAEYGVEPCDGEQFMLIEEMFLSEDGNTAVLIERYRATVGGKARVRTRLRALDISDIGHINEKSSFEVDGSYKTSRLKDGKLILITYYYTSVSNMDFSKPETFIPTVGTGDGEKALDIDDILVPENVSNGIYNVISYLDLSDLSHKGSVALLNYSGEIYVSESNIYVTRSLTRSKTSEDGEYSIYEAEGVTEIASVGYTDDELTIGKVHTVCGTVEDKWSLDERDGYLRVVTSTGYYKRTTLKDQGSKPTTKRTESASLYIIRLSDGEVIAKVENFSPNGETVQSVRFNGNKLYVCTAEVAPVITDPVYFFELSDYDNITYKDTGYMEGFSSSLIDIGEGFLVGIGYLDRSTVKVDVYEKGVDGVYVVDSYMFSGDYATEYKSYLIDREANLFGFPTVTGGCEYYTVLEFDGYKLRIVNRLDAGYYNTVRGMYIDGYIYVVDHNELSVEKLYDSLLPNEE